MQFFDVARHLDAPSQFLRGVLQPEIADIVLNVVILQKLPEFFDLGIVFNIEVAPFVAVGKL